MLNIDGIGGLKINSFKNFLSNKTNLKVLDELSKILFIKDAIEFKKDGLLNNKTFMFTGKLSVSRAEAKSLIEENAGSIVSSVSKKLDYLIIGEKPTKKNRKCKKN